MATRDRFRRSGLVVSLAGTYVATMVACGLVIADKSRLDQSVSPADFSLLAGWMAFPAIGSLILWHKRANPMGRLLVGMGVVGALATLSNAWAVDALRIRPGALPLGAAAAWLASWALVPTIGLAAFIPALFPNGRIDRPALRWSVFVAAAALVLLCGAQAFAEGPIDGVDANLRPIPNPLGARGLTTMTDVVTSVTIAVMVGFVVVSLVDLGLRFRRAVGEERAQMRWPVAALALLPAGVVVALLLAAVRLGDVGYAVLIGSQVALLVGLAAAIGVSVLRYRLYDLDQVVRRSLIITGVGASVAVVYGVVLLVFAAMVSGQSRVAQVIAVAAVAVAVQPLRERVERAADRVMRGRLAEPLAVLSALASRLDDAIVPDDVLDAIVEAIRTELDLPYVAIELTDGAGSASSGVPAPIAARFEILWQGEVTGELVVATRVQGEPLRDVELRLLDELCRRAATAVEAARLAAELRRSRERLVLSREEERRRLRRDLHDGLGPALAGMSLRADVAAGAILDDPEVARVQLVELQQRLKEAIAEVRRVVSDLRPPALDELGFVGALQEQARRIVGSFGTPHVAVEAVAPVPELPAAVEVAAYRIVGEALTNVVRHANADTCRVDIVTNRNLEITIRDDGAGFDVAARSGAGVGLESMVERSAEVGGTVSLSSRAGTGTVVCVCLPVA